MSRPSRMRRSFEVSMLRPPAIRPCAFTMSAGVLHARRHVGAHEMHGGAGLIGDELVGLEVDAPALRIADIDPGGAGEIAHDGAVLGRDLADELRADHAAGAVHVLHDHVRLAGDVLAEMLGEQPALDVGRPAGREVDQHREPLALVVGLLRLRRRGAAESRARRQRRRRQTVRRGSSASSLSTFITSSGRCACRR